jgi:hypothetical protein
MIPMESKTEIETTKIENSNIRKKIKLIAVPLLLILGSLVCYNLFYNTGKQELQNNNSPSPSIYINPLNRINDFFLKATQPGKGAYDGNKLLLGIIKHVGSITIDFFSKK